MYFCEHYKTCTFNLLDLRNPCRLTTGVKDRDDIFMEKPNTNTTFCGFQGSEVKILTEFEKLFLEALDETKSVV
jgi:hypothetical protein